MNLARFDNQDGATIIVNKESDMRRLIALGVYGIMTNYPDVLTSVKKDMGVE